MNFWPSFLNDPLFVIAFVLAANTLFLGAFVVSSMWLIRRITRAEDAAESIRGEAQQEVRAMRERARLEARNILEAARRKGEEIFEASKFLSETAEYQFKGALQSFLEGERARIQGIVDELLSHYARAGIAADAISQRLEKQISERISVGIEASFTHFQEILDREIAEYRASLKAQVEENEKKAAEEYRMREKEIEKALSDGLFQILEYVSKEVIGKTIDLETQQELAVEALLQAKKRGIFRS